MKWITCATLGLFALLGVLMSAGCGTMNDALLHVQEGEYHIADGLGDLQDM